jgi:hypothetical protein
MKKLTRGSALADLRVGMMNEAAFDCHTREQFKAEIERLWYTAQDNFLRIGRYLLQAKERLPHGEFEDMVNRDLPFSPSVGRKLRAVVEFVDSGVVPADLLPKAYSVAYEVVTMSPTMREKAVEAGVIRPDATLKEFQRFKRELRMVSPALPALKEPEPSDDTAEANPKDAGRSELERRYEQRRVLNARIAELEHRLGIARTE